MRTPTTFLRGRVPTIPIEDDIISTEQPHSEREPSFMMTRRTTVRPGQAVKISTAPQVLFRPKRVVIDPGIAKGLLITDLQVGKNSFLLSACSIPASCLGPLPFHLPVEEWAEKASIGFDTLQLGQSFSIGMENESTDLTNFVATVWGIAIDDEVARQPVEVSHPSVPETRGTRFVMGWRDNERYVTDLSDRAYAYVRPQLPFRIEGVIVAPENAAHVKVTGVRLGNRRASCSFSGEQLSPFPRKGEEKEWEKAQDFFCGLPTISVGMVLVLELEMTKDVQDRPIRGMIRGRGVY